MPTPVKTPPVKPLNLFYDADLLAQNIPEKILSKKIGVIGFGSQGYGQSLNLKDSLAQVKIALRPGSASEAKAKQAGLETIDLAHVLEWADVLVFLAPDVHHRGIYQEYFEGKLKPHHALVFSHGFSVHYQQVLPPPEVDVFLVAPKSPGHLVRSEFLRNRGVPSLVAVHQNASGDALDLALGYAYLLGSGRAGIFETTFKDETETDLFGEQAVLCGGVTSLVKAGFETLTDAGYPPELAYFECLHELKLIVDLMYEGGLEDMRYSISDTARYGDLTRGPRVVDDSVKVNMETILGEIQSGKFAKAWIQEFEAGQPHLKQLVATDSNHPLETVGKKLRQMMSWTAENRLVNRNTN
ncbi:MAG: ketol-acid reductoisomerase [Cyanobacteria bacterium]|nr:ketol-acid reductoisomerase [Cyanobacteriota bacterium]